MTSMSALAFAFKVKEVTNLDSVSQHLTGLSDFIPSTFRPSGILAASREPCQALSPCHHGPYSCGNIWLVRLAPTRFCAALWCGGGTWAKCCPRRLDVHFLGGMACWDGFMTRLWFGPCKMQTRRVVPQTLKSKWGMEKHSNSSCLSDVLRDRFGCLYHYPRGTANLQPKSYKFLWFWLRKWCCWTLVPWHLHIPQRCWLTCPSFHSLALWNMPFSRPSYDSLSSNLDRSDSGSSISCLGLVAHRGPWEVVAVEISLNKSCQNFIFSLAHQLGVKETYAGFDDTMFILASGWQQKTTIHSTIALSFTWGAGGQVAERAWKQNDWILGITKNINILIWINIQKIQWELCQKRFWHCSRRYLKWPWQICQDMSTETTWDSEEDCMTCCDRDSLVGWGLLTPRTFHGIMRFQKCQ